MEAYLQVLLIKMKTTRTKHYEKQKTTPPREVGRKDPRVGWSARNISAKCANKKPLIQPKDLFKKKKSYSCRKFSILHSSRLLQYLLDVCALFHANFLFIFLFHHIKTTVDYHI